MQNFQRMSRIAGDSRHYQVPILAEYGKSCASASASVGFRNLSRLLKTTGRTATNGHERKNSEFRQQVYGTFQKRVFRLAAEIRG